MVQYRAYGLSLLSDHDIPGLTPSTLAEPVDVTIHWLGSAPIPFQPAEHLYHTAESRDAAGAPLLVVRRSADGRCYSFDYSDGTRFLIADAGREVWARWSDPLTSEDTATYLLGPVLGFVLRLRGRLCLHASAVAFGVDAVAFAGPSGEGKSTLAAWLVSKGLKALTEDILPLRWDAGRMWADPGPPLIRLWQSSVQSLFGAPDSMPLMTPNWDKRFQPLSAQTGTFVAESLPVRVVYLLAGREPGRRAAAIRSLTPQAALLALVSNTYANRLLDTAMRAREFDLLGQMLSVVPVRDLQLPDDFTLLEAAGQRVIEDVARLVGDAATIG
jgi:hypothetical protein